MATPNTIKMPVQPLLKDIFVNIELSGMILFKIRTRIGVAIIKIGAFVIGIGATLSILKNGE